ncbi:unnamed protein product [Clavelina lepadiformis]|uniref:Hydantoinase B/oxoprolinase domain-containing protein n=1 Tax=Clavelina lepadiformis TaxID=159417 RepID=A0ABP0GA52_CLALP
MGAKNFVVVNPGDIFHLKSPGGGGYGAPSSDGQSSFYNISNDFHPYELSPRGAIQPTSTDSAQLATNGKWREGANRRPRHNTSLFHLPISSQSTRATRSRSQHHRVALFHELGFGPDGGLVSNAPYILVHLVVMQDTVQYQMRTLKINGGDCIVSNHPSAGGFHLPGLTVITPVSMIIHFNEEFGLGDPPYSARRLHDNGRRTQCFGQDGRRMINIHVEIDSQEGSATFDFKGTSPMVINKLNAPAVANSKEIY